MISIQIFFMVNNMNENIPERCPLRIDLKDWKRRSEFYNIKQGEEFGYDVCELKPYKASRRDPPSYWIFDGKYYCGKGNYVICPLFSKWFWTKTIKNSKVKIKNVKNKK